MSKVDTTILSELAATWTDQATAPRDAESSDDEAGRIADARERGHSEGLKQAAADLSTAISMFKR